MSGDAVEALEAEIAEFQTAARELIEGLGRIVVGQDEVIEQLLFALVAGGHVLLEGAPGLGKTLMVRTLADSLGLSFGRVQFTPDLMPADITGTNVVIEENGKRSFRFQKGPVFRNILLADEINRATPKTQSALLEAMQEKGVTVAGERHPLPLPFFVLATQNPIEMEGTYPLPEAQLDRFILKILVPFPGREDLGAILDRTCGTPQSHEAAPKIDGPRLLRFAALAREVVVAPEIRDAAADIVLATHPSHPKAPTQVKEYVRYGASPRGAQALILLAKARALHSGRPQVDFEDLAKVAAGALRHRLILNFEAEAEGIAADQLISAVLSGVLPH